MKKQVVKIIDNFGNELPIEKMEFLFVGEDYAYGNFKGYGFATMYSKAGNYTVITK